MAFLRIKVEGRENTRRGQSYVIMTNHQGDCDVLALYGFLHQQFRWVIKQELRNVPFLGWACAAIALAIVSSDAVPNKVATLDVVGFIWISPPGRRNGRSIVLIDCRKMPAQPVKRRSCPFFDSPREVSNAPNGSLWLPPRGSQMASSDKVRGSESRQPNNSTDRAENYHSPAAVVAGTHR